ncbi:MAG: hypothetical protein JXX14_03190 [Deltaproteobacteria bacterium]|nr:hypothetical protein [Deltaproteobacteria bacterium]
MSPLLTPLMIPSPQFTEIEQRLTGLDTPLQRAARFSECIVACSSTEASSLFAEICIRPCMTRAAQDLLVADAAFSALLSDLWPASHIQHTREAAAYVDDEVTLALLVRPSRDDDTDDTYQIPKYTQERVLTLGERKALASMPSRQTLEKAMMDPHPDVAKKLLDNPRLTEADVVRIAAKSTMAPAVLCEIASHFKWRRQKMVQKALVNNRLLHPDFALTLLPFLDRRSMSEISRDARLDERVRHGATVLVTRIDEVQHSVE